MPPGKQSKHEASPIPSAPAGSTTSQTPPATDSTTPSASQSTSDQPSAPPRSAANEVYLVPEIRQSILAYLDKVDVTRFMRVEKKAVFDAAKELYRVVDLGRVRNKMSMTTVSTPRQSMPVNRMKLRPQLRQRTYCAAVTEVQISPADIAKSKPLRAKLGIASLKGDRLMERLQGYQTRVCRMLLEDLRRKCPNLRKITYTPSSSWPDNRERWVAFIDSARTPYDTAKKTTATLGSGTIVAFRTCIVDVSSHRPSDYFASNPVAQLTPPSTDYAVQQVFNLELRHRSGQYSDLWLAHLREESSYSHLYQEIGLGELPVKLSDITRLYQLQISEGGKERLACIRAPHTLPYSLSSFDEFAHIASSSLTELHLAGASYPPVHEHHLLISFAEIPSLIEIIGSHLTRLQVLSIPLRGIESAESVCRGMLRPDTLSRRGTLAYIRVLAGSSDTSIFNILRVLSVLGTSKLGSLEIETYEHRIWPRSEQMPFISHLRS